MDALIGGISNSISHIPGGTRSLAIVALMLLAIVASLVAFATIGHQPAYAAEPGSTGDFLPGCASSSNITTPTNGADSVQLDRNPKVISPIDPAIVGDMEGRGYGPPLPQPFVPTPQGEVYVWAACLTVGGHSDSAVTHLGYIPGFTPSGGALNSAKFTYRYADYTVKNLYYEEIDTGVRQLFLEVDTPLPNELTLYLGNDEFPLSNSESFGSGQNIYVWRLDDSLGWTQGQAIPVLLTETYRLTMSRAGSAAVVSPYFDTANAPLGLRESAASGGY